MNSFNTPEIFLRRAVALSNQPNQNGANKLDAIRQSALGQMDLLTQAQGLFGNLKMDSDTQKAAIGLAIQGLEISYHILSTHLQKTGFQRKQFVDECETSVATFLLNRDKEQDEFYDEELAIQSFWNQIQTECKSFMNYFGIQTQVDPENSKISHLSVMPYFKMSQALPQKSLIASKLEEHQFAIFLFLQNSLPNQYYYEYYKDTSRIYLKLESFWEKSNYLNRFKAPIFIINALANLLWNLQHPVDAQTGTPLTRADSINLCVKASLFINNLLDNYSSSLICKIDKDLDKLKSYMLHVEAYIKNLQSAFEYESLHEINILDVSLSMHRGLRIMANKILELIYKNPRASSLMMAQLMNIGSQILQSPALLGKIFPAENSKNLKFLNAIPCTLMDLIILFSHQKASRRKTLIDNLMHSKKDIYIQLGIALTSFENQFMLPFEILALKKENLTCAKTTVSQMAIAKQFIPLVAMVMACFSSFEDTRPKNLQQLIELINDKIQRDAIIQDASKLEKEEQYYQWSLSVFLKSSSGSSVSSLDTLLQEQSKMLSMTQLLDQLGTLILENRILLMLKEFQKIVLAVLKKIFLAYKEVNNKLNHVEEAMNNDDCIQRSEKRILQPMLDDLEETVENIQKSISQVSLTISNPDFNEQQKKAMLDKTNSIQSMFEQIFNEKIKLDAVTNPQILQRDTDSNASQKELGSASTPLKTTLIKTYSCTPLMDLIKRCFNGLSSASKSHAKGMSIQNLLMGVSKNKFLSEQQLHDYLIEIIHLTATPRSNFFFQADFAQTRSAKVLIEHFLSEEFNYELPIVKILFENPNLRTEHLTEKIIIEKILELKKQKSWEQIAPDTIFKYG